MRAKEIIMERYIAFEVDKKSRQMLAAHFPPKYADFVGHHITYKFGVNKQTAKIPSTPKSIKVVGYADDGKSLEALVVEVNGKTLRPDGETYHITWSLDRAAGRKPAQSKPLVASGFTPVNPPIEIKAKPEFFK